jgi:hypothetical protein
MLVRMMEDTEVPFGVRAKIAQDLLDRAGLVAAQVHKIIPTTEDPVMRFFEGAFSDLSNWVSNPQPDPTPALESSATSNRYRHDAEPEEILEAEIVDDAEPGDDTPLRVALLADVNRWVGVFTAMVGAVVAVPSGTRELLTSTWRWLQRRGIQLRHHLAQLLPFLRRDGTARGTSAVVSSIATS